MYSQDLQKKLKELFPGYYSMFRAAEEGKEILGRMIEDASPVVINIDVILQSRSLIELQRKARALKDKRQLLEMWRFEANLLFYSKSKA